MTKRHGSFTPDAPSWRKEVTDALLAHIDEVERDRDYWKRCYENLNRFIRAYWPK